MSFFKDVKFVRKIQFGFLIIAAISTIIVANDLLQMRFFKESRAKIDKEVNQPKDALEEVIAEYRSVQFNLLKFSIKDFSSQFPSYVDVITKQKKKIDELLEKLSGYSGDETVTADIVKAKTIWKNYKNVVADAIMSAGLTQDFEMAAVVATTSGQEVGDALSKNFDSIFLRLKDKNVTLSEELESRLSMTVTFIVVGMLFGTLTLLIAIFWLAPAITSPLKKFEEILGHFAAGNYKVEIEVTSKDEFGMLAMELQKVKAAQVEKIDAARRIAEGRFEKVNPASENDELAFAFNKKVETINLLFAEVNKLIDANRRGELSLRANAQGFSGSWKIFIEGIHSILEAVIKPMTEAEHIFKLMAQGDFTEKMNGEYEGDYRLIQENVNMVMVSLNSALGHVQQTSSQLLESASEISASTEEIAASVSEQSMQTSEIASSIEDMARMIVENAETAKTASANAKTAGIKAKQSGETVLHTITGINRLAEVIVRSANTIQGLGRSSDQIGEIIQVIEEIADQTNLLALNAAIEAARAGEQGRGFAVVADEVRKLAERTTKATKEIGGMIRSIQRDTAEAVHVIQEGTQEVEQNKALARDANEALQEIIMMTSDTSHKMESLASASEAQAATSEQISKNIEQINNISQQTAQTIQQISGSAESLYNLTQSLQTLLQKFKLENNNSRLHPGAAYKRLN